MQNRGRAEFGMRIHSLHFTLQAEPAKGIVLSTGYSLTKDLGASEFDAESAARSGFQLDGGTLVSSLPMSYHSPLARLSVAIRDDLTWRLGWQYYAYVERFAGIRGFRAHVGFSSFVFSF